MNGDEGEERECRVCRGDEEDNRKLFAPCKCSGSIQWTHSDCLIQWLEHCGKDTCELCGHKFEFSPLYAEGAPEKLPVSEIVCTVVKVAIFKWIPFALRIALVALMWIIFVPWTTCWLYRLWLVRSSAMANVSFSDRMNLKNVWWDTLSGLIMAICIIFSFLALMSFADFLRFHLLDDADEGEANAIPRRPRVRENIVAREPNVVPNRHREERPLNEPLEPVAAGANDRVHAEVPRDDHADDSDDENNRDQGLNEWRDDRREERNEDIGRGADNRDWGEINEEEELEHVELNIAIDELLGIRGPISSLFRNLAWLLAFNGAYLGLFVFIPYTIGGSMLGAFQNVIPPFDKSPNDSITSVALELFRNATQLAHNRGDALQVHDLATTFLGYLVVSGTLLAWQFLVSTISPFFHRPVVDGILWALNCMAAMVKVSSLLLLKMLVLPIMLGCGIDLATLSIFHASSLDRIKFTVENMLGSMMIHWAVGIAFMLFVTVSVLQLREVVHPAIFAKIIRPQEAHPDLLKTLLSEPCTKHARRMIMSLAIYSLLLILVIYIPVRAVGLCFPSVFPLQFGTYYMLAEIQVPVELLIVHMVVLALLERYKNDIGEIQHVWLVYVCQKLGLTEYILPRQLISKAPIRPPPLQLQPQVPPPPGHERDVGLRHLPWPEDPEEELEVVLAPRACPDQVVARVSLLILCSWFFVVAIIGICVFGPLVFGRFAFFVFHIPMNKIHDPFAMATGTMLFWMGVPALCSLSRFWRALISSNFSLTSIVTDTIMTFCAVALWFVYIPLVIGVVFELFCVSTAEDIGKNGFEAFSYLNDWLLGMLMLHLGVCGLSYAWQENDAPEQVVNDERRGIHAIIQVITSNFAYLHYQIVTGRPAEGLTDVEARIPNLLFRAVWPIAVAITVLVCLPCLGGCVVYWMYASELDLQLNAFRSLLVLLLMTVACSYGTDLLHKWSTIIHDSIRNDRYLVGRQLHDMRR